MTALKRAGLQINVRIMKNTSEKVLLNEAVAKMADDMESREIGAIIWNVGQAGFHFIPEIVVNPSIPKMAPALSASRVFTVTTAGSMP